METTPQTPPLLEVIAPHAKSLASKAIKAQIAISDLRLDLMQASLKGKHHRVREDLIEQITKLYDSLENVLSGCKTNKLPDHSDK
jgi:hypothetical protein